MVRTLVFQSNNVGSIPAGPILNQFFQKNPNLISLTSSKKLNITHQIKPDIVYSFSFISLIAPFLVNNLRLSTISSQITPGNKTKLLLKQSYLILTWFYYLTLITQDKTNSSKVITFSFLPSKLKSYTLTKAPMAQKTRSKEQFAFKFFVFKVSSKNFLSGEKRLSSIDQTLLAVLLTKNSFPVFETNLLFLKTYGVNFRFLDVNYFNFFLFTKNNN